MDTTTNQQLNMDKIIQTPSPTATEFSHPHSPNDLLQEMTQKLKMIICEREFANMIKQTTEQMMDVERPVSEGAGERWNSADVSRRSLNIHKEEDEDQELDASQTSRFSSQSQKLFQKLNYTVYDGELVNDNTEININILMQIRNNIEDQISTRTNDINFIAFINNCIPDDSLTSEVNDLIQNYLILFQEERLKNEIKLIRSYLNMLNDKIHSLCDHTFVSDCIDIDPDTSVKIYYCTVCKVSDLNDKIRMIQEKCCGKEKCCDTDDY